jgi:hypothetical protein
MPSQAAAGGAPLGLRQPHHLTLHRAEYSTLTTNYSVRATSGAC